jgi:Flp pilus assembly protein TadG
MTRPLPSRLSQVRRGAIAPLAAILWIVLIAMAAFAVDTSWIVLAQSELQNASDAAALAGVNQFQTYYPQYINPGSNSTSTIIANAVAAARTAAENNAAANKAGGVSPLSLPDGDVIIGTTDASGNFTVYSAASPQFPNTVKVTLRRVSGTNGSLSLFFGPAVGVRSVDLTATATAVAYGGDADSFSTFDDGFGMLPMTYDKAFFDYFLSSGRDANGNINRNTNGNGVLDLYSNGSYAGNFGLLSLNDNNSNASQNRDWVDHGPSASDLSTLKNNNLIPLSNHPSNTWNWNGTPGFESTTVQEINDNFIGKTFIIPLYQAYSSDFNPSTGTGNGTNYQGGTGSGSNYNYNIVAFAAVKIVDPTSYGGATNRDVIVQPVGLTSDDVIFKAGSVKPLGTSTNPTYFFTVPKLTN